MDLFISYHLYILYVEGDLNDSLFVIRISISLDILLGHKFFTN
jgi:hypothetical protein